jgi:hypothetical protein
MKRRGFLGSLLATPAALLAAKEAPKPSTPEVTSGFRMAKGSPRSADMEPVPMFTSQEAPAGTWVTVSCGVAYGASFMATACTFCGALHPGDSFKKGEACGAPPR